MPPFVNRSRGRRSFGDAGEDEGDVGARTNGEDERNVGAKGVASVSGP
jgi:hypothetical protein